MKKRWFAASLAALMALSMTACGGGKAAETTAAPAETKAEEPKTAPRNKKDKTAKKAAETAAAAAAEHESVEEVREALEKAGIPMASADVTMIPQNYVKVTDETALKGLQRTLDLLDEDDDVQAVYHNWDEE